MASSTLIPGTVALLCALGAPRTLAAGDLSSDTLSIEVFSDFQCPFCARFATTLRQIMPELPRNAHVEFKDFPLNFHNRARLAHHAALAAGAQGQFWSMHDWIFSHQGTIQREQLVGAAREIGLDMPRFLSGLDDPKWDRIIEAEIEEGKRLGVTGTPTFFVNGKKHVGVTSPQQLAAIVNAELASAGIPPISIKLAPSTANGGSNTQVQLEWFGDIRSPLNIDAGKTVSALLTNYKTRLRLTYHAISLPSHPDSQLAQEALLAAAAKDRFWEMLKLIESWQGALDSKSLAALGSQAGLPDNWIAGALASHSYAKVLQADAAEAQRRNVKGVPVFFINGKRIDGIQAIGVFRDYIDAASAQLVHSPDR